MIQEASTKIIKELIFCIMAVHLPDNSSIDFDNIFYNILALVLIFFSEKIFYFHSTYKICNLSLHYE